MERKFLVILSLSMIAVGFTAGFYLTTALQKQIEVLIGAAILLAFLTCGSLLHVSEQFQVFAALLDVSPFSSTLITKHMYMNPDIIRARRCVNCFQHDFVVPKIDFC